MNLTVVIVPDPERCRVWARKCGEPAPSSAAMAHRHGRRPTASATITSFVDVRNFANEISANINRKGGAYFYKVCICTPGKPRVEFEMPHGDMLLEDRLWIPIDMYEAFYVEVT